MQENLGGWPAVLQDQAQAWRDAVREAEIQRQDLIDLVALLADKGMSEYALARAVGVQRVTIRSWLGKDKR